MKTILTLLIITLFFSCSVEKKEFYVVKLTNNKMDSIIKKEDYPKLVENIKFSINEQLKKDGMDKMLSLDKINDTLTKTIERNDSIFYHISLLPKINAKKTKEKSTSSHRQKILSKVGKTFIIPKFKDIYNKQLKTNNKPSILYFWFTKCPSCIKQRHLMNEISYKYADKVNMFSFTWNTKKTVKEYLNKKQLKFQHFTDKQKFINSVGIPEYPTIIYLNKDKTIEAIEFGLPTLWKDEEIIPYAYNKEIDERIINMINK